MFLMNNEVLALILNIYISILKRLEAKTDEI